MARETENVQISVLKHFNTQLAGTSSIHWPGMDFDSKAVTEWLRPRLFGPTPQPSRKSERRESWILDTGCFAKTGETSAGVQKENIHRTRELADAVIGAFGQQDINLQDWGAGGDPVIGIMRFEEAEVTAVPEPLEKSDLQQLTVRVPFTVIL